MYFLKRIFAVNFTRKIADLTSKIIIPIFATFLTAGGLFGVLLYIYTFKEFLKGRPPLNEREGAIAAFFQDFFKFFLYLGCICYIKGVSFLKDFFIFFLISYINLPL